mgnify:CR=1 FL=1
MSIQAHSAHIQPGHLPALVALAAIGALPALAQAEIRVMRLPAMTNVHVLGCTVERRWCDVLHGRTRGWIRRDDLPHSPRVSGAPARRWCQRATLSRV